MLSEFKATFTLGLLNQFVSYLARLKTVVDDIRDNNNDAAVLLSVGNLIHGSHRSDTMLLNRTGERRSHSKKTSFPLRGSRGVLVLDDGRVQPVAAWEI